MKDERHSQNRALKQTKLIALHQHNVNMHMFALWTSISKHTSKPHNIALKPTQIATHHVFVNLTNNGSIYKLCLHIRWQAVLKACLIFRVSVHVWWNFVLVNLLFVPFMKHCMVHIVCCLNNCWNMYYLQKCVAHSMKKRCVFLMTVCTCSEPRYCCHYLLHLGNARANIDAIFMAGVAIVQHVELLNRILPCEKHGVFVLPPGWSFKKFVTS